MALDALLARLEGRAVTPVTDGAIADVTPKPATILASTPLTFSSVTSVTCVTCVTSKNDDPAANGAGDVITAGQAAAIARKGATTTEEREVVNWLEHILEDDPVIYREILAKCRAHPDALRFFVDYARSNTVH